ncbi:MAG: MarR family transcriptional regulator [Chloroflexi bacterium]|nr:MarR family transcriptional regulator [Chloroflexota bacterium]
MGADDHAIAASLDRYEELTRAMLLIRLRCEAPWGALNITLSQLKALGLLASADAPLTGRDLATQLGVGPSAVTPLVDRLVEHGYMRREEDPHDRRYTRLSLTEAGGELLRGMMAGRRDMMADLLRQLSTEELDVMNRSFEILAGAIARAQRTAAASEPAATGAGR